MRWKDDDPADDSLFDLTEGGTATVTPAEGGSDSDLLWCVRVAFSPDPDAEGRAVLLGDDGVCVGRIAHTRIDLPIADPQLSRRHASILLDPSRERAVVEDHDSKNGTFVDGDSVTRREISEGTLVRVGGTLLELARVPATLVTVAPDETLLGGSFEMRQLVRTIEGVAATPLAVLLLGETGTGKELVARRIHELSGRRGPFVAVNCAAIPQSLMESYLFGHKRGAFTGATEDRTGYFRAAEGGTLFLDELAEMSADLQPKLLRVLESQEYSPVGATSVYRTDVRVVSATNVELHSAISTNRFRRDLYARLAGYVVRLPPLRDRLSDIPLLARQFLREAAPDRPFQLSAGFLEALLRYDWPMNVRELRAVMRRIAFVDAEGDVLAGKHLPPEIQGGSTGAGKRKSSVAEPPLEDLEAVLRHYQGNIVRIADHYGRDRRQIYRWLNKYGLNAQDYRDG